MRSAFCTEYALFMCNHRTRDEDQGNSLLQPQLDCTFGNGCALWLTAPPALPRLVGGRSQQRTRAEVFCPFVSRCECTYHSSNAITARLVELPLLPGSRCRLPAPVLPPYQTMPRSPAVPSPPGCLIWTHLAGVCITAGIRGC